MTTTTIKTLENCETIENALEFANGNVNLSTREIKIVLNPQSKKFAVQLVDMFDE